MIGVFDSGIGGLSVLRALRTELPSEDFTYFADAAHAPYGERDENFVARRSLDITRELVQEHGAKLVVVACNTATAAAIHLLRDCFPDLPFIGVEPGLKPGAAATRTGHVGVLATRSTLSSAKFAALMRGLEGRVRFSVQACDGLAAAIERADEQLVQTLCERYVAALKPLGADTGCIDTLVLGCTHYPLAREALQRAAGQEVRLVDTADSIARHARRVLEHGGLLRGSGEGALSFASSENPEAFAGAALRYVAR